ncbi:hypothetical protein H0X09_01315 [Candidatus Saccharibacteria bacterium]|nr:hypothetical protein [Candidatus Saccharibacteria bacterium]
MDTKTSINTTLKKVGEEGLSGVSVIAPSAILGLSIMLKESSAKDADFRRILTELKRQNLVNVTRSNEKFCYTLTPNGAHRLQQALIDEISIVIPNAWDKKWRVVSFDIPTKFSRQRAVFVRRLQDKGFMMLQKSMWVHPAPCFEQVEKLAGHYNILRYCSLFEVSRFDELSVRRLLRHFPHL